MNHVVSEGTPAIEFRSVSCRFVSPDGKATVALRDFSMSVAKGEVRVMGAPVDGIDPRFIEISRDIWHDLREEVQIG
jgi:NitT/TauT family transport system ATP-binding protein